MEEKELIVFIYLPEETVAVPAGKFVHSGDSKIGSFSYGSKYIERANALPVDPIALPLGAKPVEVRTNGGLYGAFRDASPDYWGRLVIAAEAKVPPEALSEIDFLVDGNATRVGNLDFRTSPEETEPQLNPPHFNQLSNVLAAAEKIEAGEEAENHLLYLLRQGSSMGGARPKCTVEWNDSLWIAKFSSKNDTVNIPRIEYATITLAGACGIQIPEVEVLKVGPKDVFLIERFDRGKISSGWIRRGFISALSLMQWDESDHLLWDYTEIAAVMRRHMAPSDIEEFYRRMVFNILVRNTDDHPRNHGFLVDEKGMSISPAYDVVPAITRHGVSTEFSLAMSVGEHGKMANVENALSRSAKFGLSIEKAKAINEELVEICRKWREHFKECGVSEKELNILEPSFEHF